MAYCDDLGKPKVSEPTPFKQKVLNACYLIGVLMISTSSINQIYKTATTHNVTSFAIAWLIMLTVGEAFHLPRSIGSVYFVWKFNCILSFILMLTLLVLVVYFKYFGG